MKTTTKEQTIIAIIGMMFAFYMSWIANDDNNFKMLFFSGGLAMAGLLFLHPSIVRKAMKIPLNRLTCLSLIVGFLAVTIGMCIMGWNIFWIAIEILKK